MTLYNAKVSSYFFILDNISCYFKCKKNFSAIGCSVASIPNKVILDQSNLDIDQIFCAKAILDGYCYAGSSYIKLKCKTGSANNDLYDGELQVKCLGNYSWDLLPFCINCIFQFNHKLSLFFM